MVIHIGTQEPELVYAHKGEIERLHAENERLRAAHQDIIRKYEKVMGEPPYWTNFKGDQLAWVREAWYGAAKISRKALCNDEQR